MTTDLDASSPAAEAPSAFASDTSDEPPVVVVSRCELAGTVLVAGLLLMTMAVAAVLLLTSPPEEGSDRRAAPRPAVVVRDAFDRRRPDSLGRAETGQRWSEVQGRWVVGPDGAEIRAPDALLDSLAIVDLGDTDGRVDVRFETGLASGAGVVVRYLDPSNYVGLMPDLSLGVWQIVVVADSQRTVVGRFSARLEAVDVTIRLRGRSLDFATAGRFGRTVSIDADPDATGVGLLGGFGTRGVWTSFEARSEAALLHPGSEGS